MKKMKNSRNSNRFIAQTCPQNAFKRLVTSENQDSCVNISPKANLSEFCVFNWNKVDWGYESYKVGLAFILPLMMSGLDLMGVFG